MKANGDMGSFSHENGPKFSKKVSNFPENRCFSKKRGLDLVSLEVNPGRIPGALPNAPLIKWREAFWQARNQEFVIGS